MQTQLHGAQQRTFDAIFQHPIARNLTWREVCSMLDSMSDIVQEINDRAVKLSCSGADVHPAPSLAEEYLRRAAIDGLTPLS